MSLSKDLSTMVDNRIAELEAKLIELKKLKEGQLAARTVHELVSFTTTKGVGVVSAQCLCGLVTVFRVALNSAEDFECPNDPYRSGRKEA